MSKSGEYPTPLPIVLPSPSPPPHGHQQLPVQDASSCCEPTTTIIPNVELLSAQWNTMSAFGSCSPSKTMMNGPHGRRHRRESKVVLEDVKNLVKPKREEEEFLRAVEVGDIPTVRKLLARDTDLDVNCTDILGRTPLRLAVENEHLDIVELLLDRTEPKKLYEALLLAISLDHDEIAEVILKHPIYEKLEKQEENYTSGNFYLSLVSEDSQFTAETTPLILAAQRNRFEIVSLLIRRGQRIEKPHEYSCKCHGCKAKVALDELRYAKSRLNAYKGLSSEAYISLSSDDPVLTAFELGQELRHVAAREKHYRGEYEGLAKKLSEYVVKLIDHVRGNDELDIILNEGVDGHGMDNHGKLTRLKLALKFNEKQFVAHPSCQKKLTSIWYGDVHAIQRMPKLLIPMSILLLTTVFPILAVIYLIAPKSKVGSFLRTPFIKFLLNSVAFFVFLALIVTFSFTEKPSAGSANDTKDELGLQDFHRFYELYKANLSAPYSNFHRLYLREFRPGIYQLLICLWIVGYQYQDSESIHLRPDQFLTGIYHLIICLWIVGLLWQECKQLYSEGLDGYVSSLFNIIDFASLKIYIASFTLRYLSFYKTWESLRYYNQKKSWLKLTELDTEASYRAYWLIADRFYWDSWDPMNICEGLFAVANVLSFSRLFYLLAANEQLGPLQISLRRMISDIMRFLVIFFIVFFAFLVGLNNLYWYYEPAVREVVQLYDHDHEHIMSNAEKAFGTIEFTFRTVYWALFGMGDPTVVELGKSYQSAFTERVGYIVYGAYNFAAVIVLLNMLIAMMSRSFDSIQNDENVEWKFARAQLYMDFIQEGGTLPPPLNIMPSLKSIGRLFMPFVSCFKYMCCRSKKQKRGITRAKFQRQGGRAESHNMIYKLEYDALNHSPGTTSQQHHGNGSGDGGDHGHSGSAKRRHGLEVTDEETEEDLLELEHQDPQRGGGVVSLRTRSSCSPPYQRSPARHHSGGGLEYGFPAPSSTTGTSSSSRGPTTSSSRDITPRKPPSPRHAASAAAEAAAAAVAAATAAGNGGPGGGPGGLPEVEPKKIQTYQSVIKSVVKRYIFESQKDDSSPIEGEIEELKQDLSSFRFEMLNTLQTQQRTLEIAIAAVSDKLELMTRQVVLPSGAMTPIAPQSPPPGSDYDRSPGGGKRYLSPSSPMYMGGHGYQYDGSGGGSTSGGSGGGGGKNGSGGGGGGAYQLGMDMSVRSGHLPHHGGGGGGVGGGMLTPTLEQCEAPLMTEHEPAILQRGVVHEYRGKSADTALMEQDSLVGILPSHPGGAITHPTAVGHVSSAVAALEQQAFRHQFPHHHHPGGGYNSNAGGSTSVTDHVSSHHGGLAGGVPGGNNMSLNNNNNGSSSGLSQSGAATIGVSSSTTSDAQVPVYRRDKFASVIQPEVLDSYPGSRGQALDTISEGGGSSTAARRSSSGSGSAHTPSRTSESPPSGPGTASSSPRPADRSRHGVDNNSSSKFLSGTGYTPPADNYVSLLESSSSTS